MKERGKPINATRKECQEGGFQAKKEVVKSYRTGMGALWQVAQSCQARSEGVSLPGMWHNRATLAPHAINCLVAATVRLSCNLP